MARKWIVPRPRRIHFSQQLQARHVPADVRVGFDLVVARAIAGENLADHLSTRVVRPEEHDYLLNFWGIHHLHVRHGRGRELLYACVEHEDFWLIDLLDHGAFADTTLPEIVLANWPRLLGTPLKLAGVQRSEALTKKEVMRAWKAGLQLFIPLSDGNVYFPQGTGLTSARGLGVAVAEQADNEMRRARSLEEHIRSNAATLAAQLGVAELTLRYDPASWTATEQSTGVVLGFEPEPGQPAVERP